MNNLSHAGLSLSVSCPNSTAMIFAWKGCPSTFLVNLKVPIRSFIAENTYFHYIQGPYNVHWKWQTANYSVHPLLGLIWSKKLQPLKYSCTNAECALYRHIALNLGSPHLRRLTDWVKHVCLAPNFKSVAYRACLEPLSGVVGSKVLTRSQYQGLAFSEIKLLTKWNRDCAKLAEQLVWVETTSLSQQGVPHSVRVREPFSVSMLDSCWALNGELWVYHSGRLRAPQRLKITGKWLPLCCEKAPFITRNRLNRRPMIA